MAAEATEATESLPKEAGLVGLDGPLDQLDLTKMLAESFEPQEQERSEETSPGGDAVEEAEPVEESTEEAGDTLHGTPTPPRNWPKASAVSAPTPGNSRVFYLNPVHPAHHCSVPDSSGKATCRLPRR